MQRNCVEPVENAKTPANPDGKLYPPMIESDSPWKVNYAGNESVSIIPTPFKAGLTPRQLTRFFAKIQRASGCWEWSGGRFKNGYGMFNAGRWPDGRQDTRYAHRVVWELHHGPIPTGAVVRHSCDNPPCCNPDHLLIGTQADNVEDARKQGKYAVAANARWAEQNPDRHALVQSLIAAPRGALARICRERNLPFRTLAVAVHRARKRLEVSHG